MQQMRLPQTQKASKKKIFCKQNLSTKITQQVITDEVYQQTNKNKNRRRRKTKAARATSFRA